MEYRHLHAKHYEAHGYRWVLEELPYWMHLTIRQEGDTKYLIVHSRIHENKEVEMPTSFSAEFSNFEIIRDQSGKIAERWL